jgi:TolB-like protein/Flp pilus assembly protein TadD/predicted Ser/Thr protein kinase
MSSNDTKSIDDGADAATVALPVRGAPAPVDTSAPTPVAPAAAPAPAASPTPAAESGARARTGHLSGPLSSFSSGSSEALVSGRYEIVRLVGVGGMGSVYQARDIELDEIVALKTLRRELVEDHDMLDRFRNEVKLARRVTHRNVARMFDIGEHQGEKFLTMEFVDGESLAELLEREKRLPLQRIVDVISAVCSGLSAAHAAGVIHRDLKPDNVMLARDGRVLVTDFGIARAALDSGNRTVGMVLGTPAYMAPEQVQGIKDLDLRVDIYALGAMLFQLFTGEDAWSGETPMAIATARLLNPPPDPRQRRRDVPDAAARIVLRCMATKREDRYPSTDEIAHDLANLTMPARVEAGTMATPTAVMPGRGGAPLPAAGDKTVAVLPFRNAGAPGDEYIADGLTDDLIDALSMTRGLRVCSRGAVAKFRGASQDPRDIGGELGVQMVVEGSVRKLPGAVRINARLISVADGFQVWAKRFDRPDADLLAINDEAAHAIAEALTVDATTPARESPSDPVAIDLYLRARNEYHKVWPEAVARSVELFQQALLRAPDDPTILAAYAIARARYNFYVGEDNELARQAAERAVAAAPNLPEAWLAIASVRFQHGDPAGAVRDLKTAVAKGPGLAEAHWLLGRILSEVGNVEEGVRRLELARTLDPSLSLARRDLARTRALLGDWAGCEALINESTGSENEIGTWSERTRMTIWRGDRELAKKYLRELTLPPEQSGFIRMALSVAANPEDPSLFAGSIITNIAAPTKGTVRRQSFFLQLEAEIMAYRRDWQKALEALARSVDAGLIDLLWLKRCPVFDGMRAYIPFIAQVARVEERASAIISAYTSP